MSIEERLNTVPYHVAGYILVDYGYAQRCEINLSNTFFLAAVFSPAPYIKAEPVNPFANTLEGNNQAHAIEAWLDSTANIKALNLWLKSGLFEIVPKAATPHQWRLARIKWCLNRMYIKGDTIHADGA